MAVPNVNQHYDCIVVNNWNGKITDKAQIAAKTANAGDVIFFKTASGEGRFIYRDNDTLKSSVLFNADVFSEYQSKTVNRASDTKYQRKTVVIIPKDNIFTDNKVQSNDVAAIHLTLKNFLVLGEYNTYMKDGYVQLNTQMGKLEMLFKLAKSLVQNMSRDNNLGVEVMLGTADDSEATGFVQKVTQEQIKAAKSYTDLTTTTETTENGVTTSTTAQTEYDCIAIQEVPMKWELGRFYNERPSFDVTTNLVEIGVAMPVEMAWSEDVTDYTYYDRNGVPNGRAAAEIEYFCQAQRGDKWLKGGWPYTFHAEGLVDPTAEYDIAVYNITYRGDAEDVQYSPKQLYLIVPKNAENGKKLSDITSAINGDM